MTILAQSCICFNTKSGIFIATVPVYRHFCAISGLYIVLGTAVNYAILKQKTSLAAVKAEPHANCSVSIRRRR